MADAGVNLLAFSGFPEGRGAQLDVIPESPGAILWVPPRDVAKATRVLGAV
jgi:hypothetical protein